MQAHTCTASSIDRKTINTECRALADEITRISESTEFNGIGIRGVDMDKETAELTRAHRQLFLGAKQIDARQPHNRILQSASLSVIAQMNAQPEALLQLFT